MKKVKVLEIGLSYKKGGIENFLLNIGENINTDSIQMDFINTFENAKNEEFYRKLKKIGKVYDIPDYRKNPIKFYKSMKKIQKNNSYDILHYHMNSAVYLLPLIVGRLCGIKVIISHSHNSSSDKGLLKNIIHNINKHFIPLFANTYFACSDLAGQWFFNNKNRSNNYYIINNAIDFEKYQFNKKTRNNMRAHFKLDDDTIVIGNVGRFKPQKNHEFIIKTFEKYHSQNKKSKLLLIGTGPLVESSKALVKKMNIDDSVLFLGERNDVEKIYQAMDVFVLPSIYEGLPLVGVEAQVSGLKCLFSDTITKEVKISDDSKFISIKRGVDLWVKEINQGVNQRKTVFDDKFDIRKNAIRLENIYRDLKEKNG